MLWRVVALEVVQSHVEFAMESRVVSVVASYQRVVEPCRIYRREWSRIVAIVMTCQRVQICQLKLGWDI